MPSRMLSGGARAISSRGRAAARLAAIAVPVALSVAAACTTTRWTIDGGAGPGPSPSPSPAPACAPETICSIGFGGVGDGGPMLQASLGNPRGFAFGPGGKLYIADTDQNRIRVVDTAGTITTLAGTGEWRWPQPL